MSNLCLGWYNRPTCSARRPIDLTPNPNADPTQNQCPDVSWFWLGLAAIGIVKLMQK
jgi:hypothetical protein